MMRGMSDEQLRAMARAAGVDDASVDLEALRRGDVQLGPEGLDPAIMAKVQQMQVGACNMFAFPSRDGWRLGRLGVGS